MRVIIAGTRTFNDYQLLVKVCDHMLKNQDNIEIVVGGAKGADFLGEAYAKDKGYPLKVFLPDWELFKKAAGPIRNWEMADYSDALIAFWDGVSPGTKSMIDKAREHGLKVKIELVKCG